MKAFTRATSIAVPIDGINVNTDQIIPARFLKASRAAGYGGFLFHDLRFDGEGAPRPGFVLNMPAFRDGRILVVDANYGCGSSREGAVYAHQDYGIVAILAPSFGDIFYNNCLKNGLVPVVLDGDVLAETRRHLHRKGGEITVDLEALEATLPDGTRHRFEIEPFWRECILKGLDEISLTSTYEPQIHAFEGAYHAQVPWVRKPEVDLGRDGHEDRKVP